MNRKLLIFFITFIIIFPVVDVLGASIYSWDNRSYLNFSNPDSFEVSTLFDDSLVGYWNFNEGTGEIANELTNRSNNGILLNSPIWTAGKFGDALGFNGNNTSLIINDPAVNTPKEITVACWVNYNAFGNVGLVSKFYDYGIYGPENGYIKFIVWNGTSGSSASFNKDLIQLGTWHFISGTYGVDAIPRIYLDGQLVGSGSRLMNGIIQKASSINIGRRGDKIGDDFINGLIDEVQIYNRSLSASEIAKLYVMGQQPDANLFLNYYGFRNFSIDSRMLINLHSANENSTLVTCSEFFENNRLVFEANNSVSLNIWTNLGRPVFSTGVWNSGNFTTTLLLDTFSVGQIDWNTYNIITYTDAKSVVLPTNVTVPYGSNQTFNFSGIKGYGFNVIVDGESKGQIDSYTLSNIGNQHIINVTSGLIRYTITANSDLGSTIFPLGKTSVNYGGSQTYTIQNKTGYVVRHVYVDNIDNGVLSSYSFNNVTDDHIISITSEQLPNDPATPSPVPSSTLSQLVFPSTSPSKSPKTTTQPIPSVTPIAKTSRFPVEEAIIALTSIILVVFGLLFIYKNGYVALEIVDEDDKERSKEYDRLSKRKA